MMKWKIWYADGTIFSSKNGAPENAPDGMQVIAEHRDGRTLLHTGGEFYHWSNNTWRARATDYVKRGTAVVKRSGSLMDLDAFKALRAEAMEWLHTPAS